MFVGDRSIMSGGGGGGRYWAWVEEVEDPWSDAGAEGGTWSVGPSTSRKSAIAVNMVWVSACCWAENGCDIVGSSNLVLVVPMVFVVVVGVGQIWAAVALEDLGGNWGSWGASEAKWLGGQRLCSSSSLLLLSSFPVGQSNVLTNVLINLIYEHSLLNHATHTCRIYTYVYVLS